MSDGIDIETSLRRIAQEEALRVNATLQQRIEATQKEVRSLRAKFQAQKDAAGPERLLSKAEVCEILGKSVRTVSRMIARGELRPGKVVGGTQRWRREWLPGQQRNRRGA